MDGEADVALDLVDIDTGNGFNDIILLVNIITSINQKNDILLLYDDDKYNPFSELLGDRLNEKKKKSFLS